MTDSETTSATALIRLYSENAATEATMMAEKMHARGDRPGHETWIRIAQAVREMQTGESHAG